MELEFKRLREEGHRRGKHKWETKIAMFGVEVPVELDFAGDEVELAYCARVITIAVDSGQLQPKMPWEELLVDENSLQGVPEQLRFDPMTTVTSAVGARSHHGKGGAVSVPQGAGSSRAEGCLAGSGS